jgi:hypothetical protein
MAKEIIQLRD